MRVVVTGASGFVGTNFIKSCKSLEIIELDLLKNKIEEISFLGVDSVLHLAALVHQMNDIPEEQYFKINRDLAYSVAKKAKNNGVKHFILLSTVKVYGESHCNNVIYDESSTCHPKDSYGRSKHEAEKLVKSLEDINFKVAIVRSPLVYGPGVKANMLNLIKLVDKYKFLPFGCINNKRSMVYVNNLVELLKIIIEKKASGIFIAGDSKPLSTTEIIKYIARGLNKNVYLFKTPILIQKILKILFPKYINRIYGSFVVTNKNTNDKLKFNPPYSSESGFVEMVQWYIKKKN
ncbi:MAG TPA: NAD-dependent epimerase/dehydratase family protein [Candidatus Paceibacterota bacterium]|nr:NAD-dependent epimerase/dehydratase family protein [Candidatus Paceibacterota bacterium]